MGSRPIRAASLSGPFQSDASVNVATHTSAGSSGSWASSSEASATSAINGAATETLDGALGFQVAAPETLADGDEQATARSANSAKPARIRSDPRTRFDDEYFIRSTSIGSDHTPTMDGERFGCARWTMGKKR